MEETVKCRNCKGTGLIPATSRSKRWVKCPICNGKGKKLVRKPDIKRRG
jgi:DnaJ-class molecular chaperone